MDLRHIYIFNDGFGLVKERKMLRITSSFLVCIIGVMDFIYTYIHRYVYVCIKLTNGYPGRDCGMTEDCKFAVDIQEVK